MPARSKPSPRPRFSPAPPALIELFERATADLPGAERRPMFGYPCVFLRGQMLCGVFQDRIMLRLSEADRRRFLELPGARPFEPMPGKPMREYVELPERTLSSRSELARWLARGLAYVETLPPRSGARAKSGAGSKPAPRGKAKPRRR